MNSELQRRRPDRGSRGNPEGESKGGNAINKYSHALYIRGFSSCARGDAHRLVGRCGRRFSPGERERFLEVRRWSCVCKASSAKCGARRTFLSLPPNHFSAARAASDSTSQPNIIPSNLSLLPSRPKSFCGQVCLDAFHCAPGIFFSYTNLGFPTASIFGCAPPNRLFVGVPSPSRTSGSRKVCFHATHAAAEKNCGSLSQGY